jgi:aspartyl-tRNA(Asn)/glutamyl-tRNA(Gln) amidotransferase subunit B
MCAKSAADTEMLAEMLAKYEAVIGLEVHAQLLTKTKIFCGCSTQFGDAPNSNTCPVCLGLPGTLPVLNKRAVELAMQASLALNCTVHEHSRFARKNYFYPDCRRATRFRNTNCRWRPADTLILKSAE